MALSRQDIYHNYSTCLKTVEHLLRSRYSWADHASETLSELAQSVLGDEIIVRLLTSGEFDPERFQPLLIERIDATRQILLPDLRKKQFFPILEYADYTELLQTEEQNDEPSSDGEQKFREHLSPETYNYLKKAFRVSNSNFSFRHPDTIAQEDIEKRILLVKSFFPNGKIPEINRLSFQETLTESQIIDCYKCVYLGIESQFPVHFLTRDGAYRAAVMTRFLLENILDIAPENLLDHVSTDLFTRHKLHSVVRFFNYSINRILGNAYPDLIMPWHNSRIPDRYWENPENRIEAVRWLIEERLGMDPENIRAIRIKRHHFTRNGLSFLYNKYYNSIGRALLEAYPFLHRWETGSVPYSYWSDENAAEAIRWMVMKKGWKASELPERIRTGTFTRKTFSEFGLATLFDKRFNRNFHKALDCAFPGRFMPWETGKVPASYWKDPGKMFMAANWIARNEGIEEKQVARAIQNRKLTFRNLKKYSIGAALMRVSGGILTNLYWPHYQKEFRSYAQEEKIVQKLDQLIREESAGNKFLDYLFYGFYLNMHRNFARTDIHHYQRMRSRIRRRYLIF